MTPEIEAIVSGYLRKLQWSMPEARMSATIDELQAEPHEIHIAFVKTVVIHVGTLAPAHGASDTFLHKVFAGFSGPKLTDRRFNWWEFRTLGRVIAGILRRKPPFQAQDLEELVRGCADGMQHLHYFFPLASLLGAVETGPRTAEIEAAMRSLKNAYAHVTRHSNSKSNRKLLERIEQYLAPEKKSHVASGGLWSSAVFGEIQKERDSERPAWARIFAHCAAAQSSTPSKAWQREATELTAAIGANTIRSCALRWLNPDITPIASDSTSQIADKDADYLKGFIWLLADMSTPELCTAIADFGLACLRKIPNTGPVSARVGFACVNVLAEIPGMEPVSQLSRMRVKVKYAVGLKLIEKALNAAAERSGLSRDDLEDIAVPGYALNIDGKRSEKLGECSAEIVLLPEESQVQVVWKNAAGKIVKSPPSEAKENHGGKLKEIKRAVADIQKMAMAQRLRIEQFLVNERKIGYQHWREHFLHHPLMNAIAKRLIWSFENNGARALGIWSNGELVNWNNEPLSGLATNTTVQLWHPLQSDPQTILSWRCWLEDHRVVQPFKQAHREVYLLTPAEEQTESYSNRFAAHVIRQHQFASLCRERGWQYRLMGSGFDGHNVPTIELPRRSIKAEFWVDIPEGNEEPGQLSGSGINVYLLTDQVRFYGSNEQMRLAEVPPVVFSEIMRDVDLFVGVTSIGNDPTWADHGDMRYGQYWQGFAFGELSQSGETRRQILERLLPQLKIASRCSLEGKFLVVRGDLHTYKIHLGSGNVLLEPGSRYLCIVPDRTSKNWEKGSLYVPFTGDQTLAIILSKAFLLAADKKITDQQILRQIGNSAH